MGECKIYVGNLNFNTRERDLDDCFYRYGKIVDIHVSEKGFGFVEFSDSRDAEDAVRGEDGRSFMGRTIRVEISKRRERKRDDFRGRDEFRGRNDRGRDDRGRGPPERRGAERGRAAAQSEHRVLIENLPDGISWQSLKDFFRDIGE